MEMPLTHVAEWLQLVYELWSFCNEYKMTELCVTVVSVAWHIHECTVAQSWHSPRFDARAGGQ